MCSERSYLKLFAGSHIKEEEDVRLNSKRTNGEERDRER